MDLWEEFAFLESSTVYNNWSLQNWCVTHGERGKLLMQEWNIDKNISPIDLPIVMDEVFAKTTKKFWWKCSECGHEFQMSVAMRTTRDENCPKCRNKKIAKTNRKNAAANGNDLFNWCKNHGEFGSTLLKEWDYQKNLELHEVTIDEISQKSSLDAEWVCSRCGHHYTKKIYTRVALGIGCPSCNRIGTSFPEQVIYRSMLQVFPDTISRSKLFDNIEYDIYIPSEKVAIEYNGSYWHKGKDARDKMKKDLCLQHGIRFMRINADNGKIDMTFNGDEICYNISSTQHKQQLKEIVAYILERLGHGIEEINFEKSADESYGRMLGRIEDNFTKYEPRLVLEWDKELNKGIEPEFFSTGSHQRVKWKCRRCGYIFENSINSRIRFQSGCGQCGYNIFDDKLHKRNKKKVVYFGINSL